LVAPSATFKSDKTCALVKSSTFPVPAVARPLKVAVATVFKSALVITLAAMVVVFPTEVTSPFILALVVTVDAVVAVAAFPPMFKLATGVVDVTTNGAVPVATVEVNCVPERFPEAATEVGVMAPRVNVMAGVVVAVATVPLTPLAVVTDAEVTVPPLPDAVKTPPVLKFKPLPTVISEGTVAPAVGLPISRLADTFCILVYVTALGAIVKVVAPVTSPVCVAFGVIAISPDPKTEVELMVLIDVPDTSGAW